MRLKAFQDSCFPALRTDLILSSSAHHVFCFCKTVDTTLVEVESVKCLETSRNLWEWLIWVLRYSTAEKQLCEVLLRQVWSPRDCKKMLCRTPAWKKSLRKYLTAGVILTSVCITKWNTLLHVYCNHYLSCFSAVMFLYRMDTRNA